MRSIESLFDRWPEVRKLRENPDYVESSVYENYSEEERAHRLSSGPLRGSRGLALQRVFWNEKEKKTISFVYFGDGLDGWLKVTHGGALATMLDENMGRVAVRTFPERTGVTANLNINYRSPALTGFLYKITTTIDQERSTDRKAFLMSEIRGPTGDVCTEATGVFVVPKNMRLQKIGDQY
ncbi:thioesterase family [Aspergillus sclerotialis]|uniref:Thioesterase family n=1 Tax=Aspergillus sclerotialis TaxID=2070753 RepID=A0A3A2Z9A4_9EURO|nr:thioesterase family [Aspergillus sclerotialis]